MKLKLLSSLVFVLFGCFLLLDIPLDIDSSRIVLDRNKEILSLELTRDDKFRYWQGLAEVDEKYKEFILKKEDRYFYYHPGVNPIALLSATFDYFFTDKSLRGASTISMQLARLYYQLETRSPLGKIQQIFAAILLEFRLSKDSIFEAYLNLIPMGRNIEGFETASLYYFRKSGKNLSRDEFYFLTLLPQRPYLVSSLRSKRWDDFEQGWKLLYPGLSFNESKQLLKRLNIHNKRPFFAPHATRLLLQTQSEKEVVSTLDLKWQLKFEGILKRYIDSQKSIGIYNAASMVVNTDSNEIVAYLGSSDFANDSIDGQVDGLLAKRSPGSTLKPFIYALAFQHGLYHGKSVVYDAPLPYRTPENYDRRYRGPITIENALVTSRNVPAVYINNELQRKKQGLYNLLNSIYPNSKPRGHFGSSIALGALEVNAWQLAELYSTLANNGEFQNLSFDLKTEKTSHALLSEEASIMVKDILRKNPRPRYQKSQDFSENEGEVYWKTGTSFGFRDAWSVGIWQNYVIVTWVGDFSSQSNPYLVGSISAAPLFFQFVDFLRSEKSTLKDYDIAHLYHKNLAEVEVCSKSGKIPNENCEATSLAVFWPGKSPIHKCEVHKKVMVAKKSGLRVCPKYKGDTISKVFEFFSSETKDLYEDYGISLKLPPKYDPICTSEVSLNDFGEDPEIISPKLGFIYIMEEAEGAVIPLKARASVSSKNLSWYLEEKFLGRSQPGETFTINLGRGNYLVRVVDDEGRIARRSLKIR